MIVYFTHSARGLSKYESFYKKIYEAVESLNFIHADVLLEENNEKFYSGKHKDRVSEFEKAIDCIKKSDIVLLEISTHSLSMGYVLHQALELEKPVICLCHEDMNAYFVEVINNEKLFVRKYNNTNIEQVVKESLEKAIQ